MGLEIRLNRKMLIQRTTRFFLNMSFNFFFDFIHPSIFEYPFVRFLSIFTEIGRKTEIVTIFSIFWDSEIYFLGVQKKQFEWMEWYSWAETAEYPSILKYYGNVIRMRESWVLFTVLAIQT